MTARELKNKIDPLWEEFWTGGITNPLTVIEQITFLIFSRLLDIKENQNERKRLDEGLTSSKASSLKESIRLAHNDLGDYYYNIGDLKEAFQCYAKSREYGTSVKHTLAL